MNILKTTELYTLKQVNYMVCEWYLNKAVLKKKSKKLTNTEKEIQKKFISILLRTLWGLSFILIVHYTLNKMVIFIQHLKWNEKKFIVNLVQQVKLIKNSDF